MIRNIIEFFRKENDLSILDLTLDICSTSMYYFYLRGVKNLSEEKEHALALRLGYKPLNKADKDKFQRKIHDCLNQKFLIEKFIPEAKELLEYRKQLLFEEDFVIDYLLIITYYYLNTRNNEKANIYLELLENYVFQMTPFQKINYLLQQSKILGHRPSIVIPLLKEAEKTLSIESANETPLYGHFFALIATCYYQIRKYKACELNAQIALNIFRKYDDFNGIVKMLNFKGFLRLANENYEEDIPFLLSNLDKSIQINNSSAKCHANLNLMICYGNLEDKEKFKKYYQQLLEYISNSKTNCFLDDTLVLITCLLEKFSLKEELHELLNLIKENRIVIKDSLLQNTLNIFDIKEVDEKFKYMEDKLLPNALSNSNFNVCQLILTKIIYYYENNRRYKKAAYFKENYIELLKEFYN